MAVVVVAAATAAVVGVAAAAAAAVVVVAVTKGKATMVAEAVGTCTVLPRNNMAQTRNTHTASHPHPLQESDPYCTKHCNPLK